MTDNSRLRIVVLRVIVLSILLTLLGRLTYLQVAQGAIYRKDATNNRVRSIVTQAARGQILDDRGVALVSNRTALVVSVTRSILRSQPQHGAAVLDRLSKVVGIPAAQISLLITPCGEKLVGGGQATSPNCWNGSPLQPVPIQSYSADNSVQVRQVLAIEEHAEDFKGVQATYAPVRQYPQSTLAAHALGYLGPITQSEAGNPKYHQLPAGSLIGKAGLEQVYDDQLRGTDGVQSLLVDKDATVTGIRGTVPAKAGDNLVLSIDSKVQKIAEDALATGILNARQQQDVTNNKKYAAPNGAAIVMEVATGRLVAMASYPTYDPTAFVGGISTAEYRALLDAPGQPLISTALQGTYAPGSTFKLASTAGAVVAGYSLTGRDYPCPSQYAIGNSIKHNFESESAGTLDFHDALVISCDTVYYKLAVDQWTRDQALVKAHQKPLEVFSTIDKAFGFGSKTGIDLPDERSGLITDRAYDQAFWEKHKADYCAGAKRRPKTDPIQAFDQEFCTDGYRLNAGDAANEIIGQGSVLVTPLQLASAYSALANGGSLMRPELAKGFISADGKTYTPIAPVKTRTLPVTSETLSYIRNALADVVRPPGSAKQAFASFPLDQLAVGGKTGTADVNGKSPTSWFASFAPVGAPKYVVVVMIPEGGTGGTTAAPIAAKIWAGMYGLEGQSAALLDGSLPPGLPVVRPDGSIAPPGTHLVVPPTVIQPTAVPSPGTTALGPSTSLPWAEEPRRFSAAPS